MRFRLLTILALGALALPLVGLYLAGIAPQNLGAAAAVGSGLTAKLACSGARLSGFDDAQGLADVASYSPVAGLVSLERRDENTFVADIFGFGTATARFYPGLGCTLQYPGSPSFAELRAATLEQGGGPWQFDEAGPPADSQLQMTLAAILRQDAAEGLDTRALLVVQGGRIVGEAYAAGYDADTPLLGWSMAKSVTAMMLGRLEAMGRLSVEETGLFPAWEGDERSQISIEHLLRMVSGLAFDEPYVPGSDSTRMLFMSPSAAAVALASPGRDTPGSYFYYSSGTTNLLAYLAWQRTGSDTQGMLEFFAREIAAPLGLQRSTFELDASGVYVGSSFLYAPARDWARFGLLMLNDGIAGGQRLLPPAWVERATTPNTSTNDPRYGYQFWLNRGTDSPRWPGLDRDAYAMLGNRGQVVMMLPTRDALIVRLGWTAGDYPTDQRLSQLQALL